MIGKELSMTKTEIKTAMKPFNNGAGVITKTELATFFGINPRHVSRYLVGLKCISGKYYLTDDVATAILREVK